MSEKKEIESYKMGERETDRQTNRKAGRQTETEPETVRKKQTYKWTGRKTDRRKSIKNNLPEMKRATTIVVNKTNLKEKTAFHLLESMPAKVIS